MSCFVKFKISILCHFFVIGSFWLDLFAQIVFDGKEFQFKMKFECRNARKFLMFRIFWEENLIFSFFSSFLPLFFTFLFHIFLSSLIFSLFSLLQQIKCPNSKPYQFSFKKMKSWILPPIENSIFQRFLHSTPNKRVSFKSLSVTRDAQKCH